MFNTDKTLDDYRKLVADVKAKLEKGNPFTPLYDDCKVLVEALEAVVEVCTEVQPALTDLCEVISTIDELHAGQLEYLRDGHVQLAVRTASTPACDAHRAAAELFNVCLRNLFVIGSRKILEV